MKTIEATATSQGSREQVWSLLADARAWSDWGAWKRVEVEDGAEHGPGAVRVMQAPGFTVRERVTHWVPGERMEYEMLDGMKVTGYRASVTLDDGDGTGTRITWSASYEKAGPLTAGILRLAVRDACKRLAKAAGR